jgi:hypothetical protein
MKQAQKLFWQVQRNFKGQFKFVRNADLTSKHQEELVDLYNEML